MMMADLEEMEQEVRELDGQPQKPGDPPVIPQTDSRDPLEILIAQEEVEGVELIINQLNLAGSLN